MATTVARLEAILSAQTRDFDRAMDKSHTKMERVGAVARKTGLIIGGGLVAGLGLSVKAALDAQSSQSRLATTFKTAGIAMGPYIKQIKAAEAAGRKLGFTDEDTKTALGSLVVATKSYTTARQQLTVAQDIARFKDVDLATATKLLTSATAGGQRALKQLGLSIQPFTQSVDKVKEAYRNLTPEQRKNTEAQYNANLEMAKLIDKHKTMNEVIQLVREKLSGQAQAYADTAAGGMAQFRAQMDHLEVSLGTGLIPLMTKLSEVLSRATEFFSEHNRVAKIVIISLGALAAAMLSVSAAAKIQTAAIGVATAAVKLYEVWVLRAEYAQLLLNVAVRANPYIAAATTIAVMSAALVVLWERSKTARTIIEILSGVITMGLSVAIIEAVRHWHDLTGAISAFPEKAISAALGVVHSAVQALNAGLHAMVRALEKVVDLFKWITGKAGSVAGAVGGIAGAVGGAVGSVVGHLNPHGEGEPGAPSGALGPTGSGNMGSIIGAANVIDSKHFPYLWGGGHSGATMNGPYDCSGAVSALLRAGGLLKGSLVSGDFMNYGKPGLGKKISILANPEHVYAILNGKAWGTSGQNPGGGAGWFSGGVRSGFAIRHPEGFDTGGWLKPGLTLAMNNTGRPERVLGPGEGGNFVFNFPNYVGSRQELMSMLRDAAAQFQRRNNRTAMG